MVSYNSMVNAGPYFEQVTGVPATRTYTHVIAGSDPTVTSDPGRLSTELTIELIDAGRNRPSWSLATMR